MSDEGEARKGLAFVAFGLTLSGACEVGDVRRVPTRTMYFSAAWGMRTARVKRGRKS